MVRLVAVGIAAATLGAVGAGACDQASSGSAPEQSVAAAATSAAPPVGAGMRIYRDPDTGELTTPPPGAPAQPSPRNVQPGPGMLERPGATPAGGVLLDGVPKTAVRSTRDAAGNTATRCEPAATGAKE